MPSRHGRAHALRLLEAAADKHKKQGRVRAVTPPARHHTHLADLHTRTPNIPKKPTQTQATNPHPGPSEHGKHKREWDEERERERERQRETRVERARARKRGKRTGLKHADDDVGGGLARHDGIRSAARHRSSAAHHNSGSHQRNIAIHVHTKVAAITSPAQAQSAHTHTHSFTIPSSLRQLHARARPILPLPPGSLTPQESTYARTALGSPSFAARASPWHKPSTPSPHRVCVR